jgi:hypothetical protein
VVNIRAVALGSELFGSSKRREQQRNEFDKDAYNNLLHYASCGKEYNLAVCIQCRDGLCKKRAKVPASQVVKNLCRRVT